MSAKDMNAETPGEAVLRTEPMLQVLDALKVGANSLAACSEATSFKVASAFRRLGVFFQEIGYPSK